MTIIDSTEDFNCSNSSFSVYFFLNSTLSVFYSYWLTPKCLHFVQFSNHQSVAMPMDTCFPFECKPGSSKSYISCACLFTTSATQCIRSLRTYIFWFFAHSKNKIAQWTWYSVMYRFYFWRTMLWFYNCIVAVWYSGLPLKYTWGIYTKFAS